MFLRIVVALINCEERKEDR